MESQMQINMINSWLLITWVTLEEFGKDTKSLLRLVPKTNQLTFISQTTRTIIKYLLKSLKRCFKKSFWCNMQKCMIVLSIKTRGKILIISLGNCKQTFPKSEFQSSLRKLEMIKTIMRKFTLKLKMKRKFSKDFGRNLWSNSQQKK